MDPKSPINPAKSKNPSGGIRKTVPKSPNLKNATKKTCPGRKFAILIASMPMPIVPMVRPSATAYRSCTPESGSFAKGVPNEKSIAWNGKSPGLSVS